MNEILKNTYQAVIAGDMDIAPREGRAALHAGMTGGKTLSAGEAVHLATALLSR